MRTISWHSPILFIAIAMTGCTVAKESPQAATTRPSETQEKPMGTGAAEVAGDANRGWYLEHAGQGMFQPCGQSRQWRIHSPELRARAKDFGLDQDTPVYVRLLVVPSANGEDMLVSKVEQFGSPTPVRDCGMTGVVTQ